MGKNLTVTVSEDEIIDADYLRKVLEGEANKDESVFYLWDSEELTKLIDYMSENDLIIAAGQYSFNQACNFEDGFFTLNNGEKQQVFKFIKKDTTVTETIELPEPIVAEWGEKTVTMEYVCITDIIFHNEFGGGDDFKHGYLAFFDSGDIGKPIEYTDLNYNFIDYNGNRLFESGYNYTTDFDSNGVAVAYKKDKGYVWINSNGDETGFATRDDYDAFRQKMVQWDDPVVATYPDRAAFNEENDVMMYGNAYNGLIPIIVQHDYFYNPMYLGLIDVEGNIVIEPTYEISYRRHAPLYLTEGYCTVGYDDGENVRLAIIKVSVDGDTDNIEYTANMPVLPQSISTDIDGKTISIEFDKITNIYYPGTNQSDIYYINGFARFLDYGDLGAFLDGEMFSYKNNYNYIDTDGKRLFDEGFSEATHFDENSIAVVQKHDDSYVFVNSNGEEIGSATSDDFCEWESKLEKYCPVKVSKDYKLKELYTEDSRVHEYGNNYNGLIPFENTITEGIDNNYTIGFADEDGNIVVEPIIDADAESYFISEDKMVVRYKNCLTIIKLTVPDISKGESDITANVEKTQEKSGADLTGTLEDGRTVTVKIEADDELKDIIESGKYTIIQSTMLN